MKEWKIEKKRCTDRRRETELKQKETKDQQMYKKKMWKKGNNKIIIQDTTKDVNIIFTLMSTKCFNLE